MLFDLKKDPHEVNDLGADPDAAPQIARLTARLLSWATAHHNRVTYADSDVIPHAGKEPDIGVLIGFWDETGIEKWHANKPKDLGQV